MPLATYTSTAFNNQPKYDATGVQHVNGAFAWTAAGTVGDVLWLAKLPHGAKIVEFHEYHSNGQTAAAISFGFDRGIAAGGGGNASCLVASGAVATENRMALAPFPAGIQISLSDLDPVRYAILTGKAESGTFTISVSGGFGIFFRFDGGEPV